MSLEVAKPAFGIAKRDLGRSAARSLALLISLALVAGCGSAEDKEIESKLGTVASHRSAHPHYPVVVFGDFGQDNQPVGISVDVYGNYVHTNTKPNARLNALSSVSASEKLERTFERAILAAASEEASTPPPKLPLPTNADWKLAPHPNLGTYTIVSRCGSQQHSFEIPLGAKTPADLEKAMAGIRPALLHDADVVVGDGLKSEEEQMKALGPPNGFSLCTTEILQIQQGNRGVEPHLMGGPLLLTPIDKALAMKGLESSIRKLLDSTAKLKPTPSLAHLVIDGPSFHETYEVAIGSNESKEKGIKAALDGLGVKLDDLNKK